MREKNICTTILLQSLSQLISTYGESGATTICNNADRMIYLGSNDLRSAKEIAQRADLLTADVLTMAIGKEIFFQRGQKPILTNCYNVFTDPAYAEMLKIAAEAEREEKEQEQHSREAEEKRMLDELDEICNLGNLFQDE